MQDKSYQNISSAYVLEKYNLLTPNQQTIVIVMMEALADKAPHPLDELSLSLVKMAQEMCIRGNAPVIALGNAAYILSEPVHPQQFRAAMDELERRFSGYDVMPWEVQ